MPVICKHCDKKSSFNLEGEPPMYCKGHRTPNMINVTVKICQKCHSKIPTFNYPGQKGGIYCKSDAKEGMVDVVNRKCAKCKKQNPCYNFEGEKTGICCQTHKEEGMIDVNNRHKLCKIDDCKTRASYNLIGEITPLYCKKHAEEISGDMVDVTKVTCKEEGCPLQPNFNFKDSGKPIYCKSHKEKGMVDVIHPTCEKCDKRPHYNNEGETRARYCTTHKEDGMVNIINKTCIEMDCPKLPIFGNIGGKAQYCKTHAEGKEGMIDVKNARCKEEGCPNRASYNNKGEKRTLYCAKHKEDDMVLVGKRTCPECEKIPVFNKPNEKLGIYCNAHKKTGMVNVVDTTCEECEKRANFNHPSEKKGRFCTTHKEKGMIHKSKMLSECIVANCDNEPLFNVPNKKPIYCYQHMEEEMVNIIQSSKCSKCKNPPLSNYGDKYYCMEHHPDQNTEDNLKKSCKVCDLAETEFTCNDCKTRKHRKEWEIVCLLKKKIPLKAIFDSSLPVRECSNRRPDVYYQCLSHAVIVEIDEHQHRDYQEQCECARISEIVGSLGGLPLTIIRYNPDSIKNKGKTINISKENRFEKLVETTKKELSRIPSKFEVNLIQLFYDDNYENYQEYKTECITNLVAV